MQLLHPTPDRSRAIGERYLGEIAALAAHVAEVGAAGLSADQFAFQQRDRTAMLAAQEECGRRAHQAAAEHQHIATGVGSCLRHPSTSRVFISNGLTGACARSRPTDSIGTPAAAATISAPAWPQ